ncbi:hypothetical protein Aperf_G00000121111 [Anoplocephala perfoliata]
MTASASSSMVQSGCHERYHERLATVQCEFGETMETIVKIRKPKSAELETELKLRDWHCKTVISFQKKLAFIGGWKISEEGYTRSVDLMDPRTGGLSPLPEMLHGRCEPPCAASENHIFVFVDRQTDPSFTPEFYDSGSERWLSLPPMIVIRIDCAAVYVPGTGVVVLGGVGETYTKLKETEMLMCESNGGKDEWTWRATAPMLKERGKPLAVCCNQRLYVVDSWCCQLSDIEMLDLSTGIDGYQWTSLASFGPIESSLMVGRMVVVDNELFIYLSESTESTGSAPMVAKKVKADVLDGDFHVVELETDPKIQYMKLREMKRSPFLKIWATWGLITVRVPSS